MGHSRIARARGLAQAISECRDDARLDGIREGAAEIVELLNLPITDDRGAVGALRDIAKVDHIDAVLDPARPLRIAKAWLREHDVNGGQS
jgi:hypothetical protein